MTPHKTLALLMLGLCLTVVGCQVYRSGDRETFDAHAKDGAPKTAALFGVDGARLIESSGSPVCDRGVSNVSEEIRGDHDFEGAITQANPPAEPNYLFTFTVRADKDDVWCVYRYSDLGSDLVRATRWKEGETLVRELAKSPRPDSTHPSFQ